ncbi:MAG: precorrin-6Y-methylase [bacterium]|nr:MAG: precorrin-6Y-methylase [bacterium]
MLTIAGSGMTDYSVKELADRIDFKSFDFIYIDKNYLSNKRNEKYWSIDSQKVIAGSFSDILGGIIELLKGDKDKRLLYVVTGNPMFFSGATILLDRIIQSIDGFKLESDVNIIGSDSCKDYLIRKLALAEQDMDVISLHGRSNIDLSRFLIKKYTFILADKYTLSKLRDILTYLNPDQYTVTLASKLGYIDGSIEIIDIDDFLTSRPDIDHLMPYVLLIERKFKHKDLMSKESEFEKDSGMITKSYKRHLSLQELNLKANLLMWDIGAGSGSVGIDAYKTYRIRVVFFELKSKRAEDIRMNLKAHYVVGSRVLEGDFMEYIQKEKERPDRIFVGGGGDKSCTNLPVLYRILKDGGILVANYVAIEHMAKAVEILRKEDISFSIKSLSLTTFKGTKFLLSEPERLMFQIKVGKSEGESY